jgi:hypothetical protein
MTAHRRRADRGLAETVGQNADRASVALFARPITEHFEPPTEAVVIQFTKFFGAQPGKHPVARSYWMRITKTLKKGRGHEHIV